MATLPHILIVDDDPAITDMVVQYLCAHDMRVSTAYDGAGMDRVLAQCAVDAPVQLVLMDLRLRGENGLQLVLRLRERSAVPVIILTGQAEEADRVMGLELAADDYVVKPFSPRELLARIRAVLRRYAHASAASAALPSSPAPAAAPSGAAPPAARGYRFEGWELNLGLRRLQAGDGREIELSMGEFSLLHALCRAPRRVLSREQLLDMTRLDASAVYDRAIDVQILRLRRKIEVDPTAPRLIRTERGVGYIFDAEVRTVL